MESYDTVVEAINGLKAKGYTLDMNLAFDKISCADNDVCLHPDEFDIKEVYRFEGNSDPDDEDVVYAVASRDGKIKGVITSAFGTYADSVSTELLKKFQIHHV